VMQEREFMRLGGMETIKVDVRIIAATNCDLRQMVEDGRFREDLYYRLNVVPLRVPALRERLEDLPLLVKTLMRRLCERNNLREKPIDDEVFDELRRYDWPGNVRELQNVLERLLIMSPERITTLDLPEEILGAALRNTPAIPALREFRDRAEREHIIATLRRHNGNVSQAAIELGVGRTYLHKRLAVLQISKKDFLA
jgi:two-component system, NtrC family, nitrogen regulation response regulator NtrX